MSLLSAEQTSALMGALQSELPAASDTDQPSGEYTEQSVEASPEEGDGADSEEQYASEQDDHEQEEEHGHNVPYSRFSQVITARNEARAEAEEMREQFEAMQQEMDQLRSMARLFGPGNEAEAFQPDQGQDAGGEMSDIQRLQSQMHEMMVVNEQAKLERELSQIAEDYPGVSRDMLLQSIINDPSQDLRSLASEYSEQIAEIEEAAIARFIASQNDSEDDGEAAGGVPPEVAGWSGRSRSSAANSVGWPKNM